MAQKGKKAVTQQTLCGNQTFLHEADSQGSQEPEQQEVAETPVENTTECLSETQTEVAIDLAEEGRGFVKNPIRNPTVNPVGGHRGQSIEGMQSWPHQNKDLSGDAELLLQHDVDAIEVDPLEVPDPCVIKVVADQTIANKADNLSDSISNSEIRASVVVLKKQKETAELKAKIESLKREKADGFVGEQNQMGSNEHTCQLSLECSKHVQDPNVYSALSQRKLTMYLIQVNDLFRQKSVTYLTKLDKVLFAANYLAGTIKNKWKLEDEQIVADPMRNHIYAGFCKFLQEQMKLTHIRQVEIMMQIGNIRQ